MTWCFDLKGVCGAFVVLLLSVSEVSGQGRTETGTTTEPQTRRVIDAMRDVFDGCRGVEDVYLPDCVGRAMQAAAGKISRNPAYWEGYVALTRVSRVADMLVRENVDREGATVRAKGYRLRPVPAASLPRIGAIMATSFARAEEDLSRVPAQERRFFDPIRAALADRPWP